MTSNGGWKKKLENEQVSIMWWELSEMERQNHHHLIKVRLLSPFLFARIYESTKWISWCQEAELVDKKRFSSCDLLSEEEHASIDLVGDAITKLENYFDSAEGSARQKKRLKDVMDDMDCCLKYSSLKSAIVNASSRIWFSSLRSEIKAEDVLKKDAAIVLTTWIYCDYIKLLLAGNQPIESYVHDLILDDNLTKINEKGKELVEKKEYEKAISIYGKLLIKKCYNYVVYGNRAFCFLKLHKFGCARDDGRRAITLCASWGKGQYRYAQALGELGLYEKGISALEKSIALCTENKEDLLRLIHSLKDKAAGVKVMAWKKGKYLSLRSLCDIDKGSFLPLNIPDLVKPSSDDESTESDWSVDSKENTELDIEPLILENSSENEDAFLKEDIGLPLLVKGSEDKIDAELIPAMFQNLTKKRSKYRIKKQISFADVRSMDITATGNCINIAFKEPAGGSFEEEKNVQAEEKAPALEKEKNAVLEEKREFSEDFAEIERKPLSLDSLLRQGTDALLAKKYSAAIQYYGQAVNSLTTKSKLTTESKTVLMYSLGTAHLESGSAADLLEAHRQYGILLEKFDEHFVLAFYGIGRAFYRQNRFYKVRNPLQTAWSILEKCGIKEKNWPGTDIFIQETKNDKLKNEIKSILARCIFPPRPDATCRFHCCNQLKTYIYFSDPDFKGFIRLICNENCIIEYHLVCWKKYKIEERIEKLEKDFIDRDCLTPGCSGFIFNIQVYNENSKENDHAKTRFDSKRYKSVRRRYRVDKSKRVQVSSLKHLEKIKNKRERRQQYKMKQSSEKGNEADRCPGQEIRERSRSSGQSDKTSEISTTDFDLDLNFNAGTIIVKKKEETDLDKLFPSGRKQKKKRRKAKVKETAAADPSVVNFRHDGTAYGSPDSHSKNLASSVKNACLNYEEDKLVKKIEYNVFKVLLGLTRPNGFIHLEQQKEQIERQLDINDKDIVKENGGLASFMKRFPFFHFDTDDTSLVYLNDEVLKLQSFDKIALDIIHNRSGSLNVQYNLDKVLNDITSSRGNSSQRYSSSTSSSDNVHSAMDELSEFPLEDGTFDDPTLPDDDSKEPSVCIDLNISPHPFVMIPLPLDRPSVPFRINQIQEHLQRVMPFLLNGEPLNGMDTVKKGDVISLATDHNEAEALRNPETKEAGTMTDESVDFKALYFDEKESREQLLTKLDLAMDSFQKQKSRLTVEVDQYKEKIKDMEGQNGELKKEVQSLKDSRDNDARLRQAEKKKNDEELKKLERKLNSVSKSKLNERIQDLEQQISTMKKEYEQASSDKEKQLTEHEDIINRMSTCINEQSRRAYNAELKLVENMNKLLDSMYFPLYQRTNFALSQLEKEEVVLKSATGRDLHEKWQQYKAALDMERRSVKDKIHDIKSKLTGGYVLNYEEIPEILLPTLSPPQIPDLDFLRGTLKQIPAGTPQSHPTQLATQSNGRHSLTSSRLPARDYALPNTGETQMLRHGSSMSSNPINILPGTDGATKPRKDEMQKANRIGKNIIRLSGGSPGPANSSVGQELSEGRPEDRFVAFSSEPNNQTDFPNKTVVRDSPTQRTNRTLDKISIQLGAMFPKLTRTEIDSYLLEYRRSRPNSKVKGVKVEDIIKGVENIISHEYSCRNETVPTSMEKGKVTNGIARTAPPVRSHQATSSGTKPRSAENAWSNKSISRHVASAQTKHFGLGEPCVICHEDMISGISELECGHSFHRQCLTPWLNKKKTCPTCRDYALLPTEYPSLK